MEPARNQREEALELEEHSGSDSPDMRIKRILLKKSDSPKKKVEAKLFVKLC